MYQGQSAGKIVVREVWEVASQLSAGQHTLIDNIFVRQRTDVEVLVVDTILYTLTYLI